MTLAATEKAPRNAEARRLWIQRQAEQMGVPAWATPRWQSVYGQKGEA